MKKYSYDDAVEYLEEHGIGCDPCADYTGEYVCDLLDERYDGDDDDGTYYFKSTLDGIIEDVKVYLEERQEEDEEDE